MEKFTTSPQDINKNRFFIDFIYHLLYKTDGIKYLYRAY